MKVLALIAALLSAGCGYLGSARVVDPETLGPEVTLIRTIEPILQQSENDCGPAALTMVLRYLGDPITPAETVAALPPREGGGVKAGALRDFAKQRKFDAWVFEGKEEDLPKEIARGRPLIVGLIKPYIDKFRHHFEVVAGFDATGKRVVTLDPGRGWTVNTVEGFMAEWNAAGRPVLIVLPAKEGGK
jgi:ABC-type bacteriocin/lantibiotic exporter with double-glycine peptidase domain